MTPSVLPTSPSHSIYEGFIARPTGAGDAWVRLEGVDVRKQSGGGGGGAWAPAAPAHPSSSCSLLRHARLVLGPELEEVMKVRRRDEVRARACSPGGATPRFAHIFLSFSTFHLSLPISQPHAATLAARLRDSPSVPAFLVELRALAGRALAEEAEATGPSSSSRLPPPAVTAAAAAALEAAGPAAFAALTTPSHPATPRTPRAFFQPGTDRPRLGVAGLAMAAPGSGSVGGGNGPGGGGASAADPSAEGPARRWCWSAAAGWRWWCPA
jgi:hypothetical protein